MAPLKIFQASQGLQPDGIIGPLTFGAVKMCYSLTPIQTAHLLGQAAHESANFTHYTENLRYSAANLLKVFRKYYTPELAKKHAYKPSVIANRVYGGRMGNGLPNDGWTYRGRGFLQLTGRSNYEAFAVWAADEDVINCPDVVAGKYALDSAVWFFEENNLFSRATDLSVETILAISRGVNLGSLGSRSTPNGLEDRIEKTLQFRKFIT